MQRNRTGSAVSMETLESRQLMAAVPISDNPIPLTPGSVADGSLDTGQDIKQYAFSVDADGAMVQLASSAQAIDRGFLGDFTLCDAAGTPLDRWQGDKVRLEQNLSAGQYVVQVNDYNHRGRGTFSVGLEFLNLPFSSDLISLVAGGVVDGTVDGAVDVKQYAFSVDAPSSMLQLATNGQATDRGFLADFTLYNAAGVSVDRWQGDKVRLEQNVPAGQYMLKVSDYSYASRGTFSIDLEFLNLPFSPNPVALARGGVVADSISRPLDVRQYVFNVNAQGGMVQLVTGALATDKAFLADFTLYNAAGAPVDRWQGSKVRLEQNLPAGQYMLKVSDYSYASRGTFGIGLEFLNLPFSPDALPLANGKSTSGKIGSSLEVKEYAFAATGKTVQFTSTSTVVDSGFLAQFTVYNSAGAAIGQWTGKRTGSVTVTPKAYYVLKVSDYSLSRRGNFTVTAQGVRPMGFAPAVASLSASPSPVRLGQSLTLTANGVTDLNNDVSGVRFYRESNGVAGLQAGPGGDVLLGTSTAGYQTTFSSTLLGAGTRRVYAQADDTNGAMSNVVWMDVVVK